jgi:hypothetical protein
LAILLAYLLQKIKSFLLVRKRFNVEGRGKRFTLAQRRGLIDNLCKNKVWLYSRDEEVARWKGGRSG